MDLQVKKLRVAELHLFRQLLGLWQREDGISEPVFPSDAYLCALLEKDSFHLLLALDGENVIGGLTAFEIPTYPKEGAEVFLYEIGVHEAYRKKGIAAKMIEALKALCIAKNIRIIYVGTETDNLPAQQLYKSSGGKGETISWFTYDLEKGKKL